MGDISRLQSKQTKLNVTRVISDYCSHYIALRAQKFAFLSTLISYKIQLLQLEGLLNRLGTVSLSGGESRPQGLVSLKGIFVGYLMIIMGFDLLLVLALSKHLRVTAGQSHRIFAQRQQLTGVAARCQSFTDSCRAKETSQKIFFVIRHPTITQSLPYTSFEVNGFFHLEQRICATRPFGPMVPTSHPAQPSLYRRWSDCDCGPTY